MRKYTFDGQDFYVPDNFYLNLSPRGDLVIMAYVDKKRRSRVGSINVCDPTQEAIDALIETWKEKTGYEPVQLHPRKTDRVFVVEGKTIELDSRFMFCKRGNGDFVMFGYRDHGKFKFLWCRTEIKEGMTYEQAMKRIDRLIKKYDALKAKGVVFTKMTNCIYIEETKSEMEETVEQMVMESGHVSLPEEIAPVPEPKQVVSSTTYDIVKDYYEEEKPQQQNTTFARFKNSLNNFKESLLDRMSGLFKA